MSDSVKKWTFGPVILITLFFIAAALLIPDSFSLDRVLLGEELVIAAVLIGAVFMAKKFTHAGWRKKSGLAWLWLAGPLWLAVLSPIGGALPFIQEHTVEFGLIALTSLLVGLNEETIFRGFLLNGLRTRFGPMAAAILSSLAFGILHSLNALSGAEPMFLVAQMIVAFGSGLVLAAVTMRAGSIWPAVFLHFAGDAVGLAYLGGFEQATQTAEAAPGMMIGGMIFVIWGAFWIWWMNRRGSLPAPETNL